MRIVHLSTSDISGGAARAAYRLHRGLRETGVESTMFVRSKHTQDKNVDEWSVNNSFFGSLKDGIKHRWLTHRFQQYRSTRPDGLEAFSQARTLHGSQIARSLPEAAIYNLHWIRHFIDPGPFFQIVQQPVVWTLHDMNAFTGGCHYNVGCRRFEESCGRCPQLGSSYEDDLSRTVWVRKHDAYRQAIDTGQLHIVAPSEWLADEARASALLSEAPVYVIPYGVDQNIFSPRETKGLQATLGMPVHHRIILFVAQAPQNHRKGFDLLVEALSSLTANDVTLLSVGGQEPNLESTLPHIHLGTIESNLLLSVFYSFADFFVIPSRQDNLPNTVLESMACGTPVVGFDTGGIPDMVRPDETGWLAEAGSVRSLRDAIETALSDENVRNRMGKRSREVVEEEYTLDVQARAYQSLYQRVIRDQENA